jgi:hypothetical protein
VIIDADENQIGNFHTKLPPETNASSFYILYLHGSSGL